MYASTMYSTLIDFDTSDVKKKKKKKKVPGWVERTATNLFTFAGIPIFF